MSSRKRLGYNWKARQHRPASRKHEKHGGEKREGDGPVVELDKSLYGGNSLKSPLDTNEEVVLPKRPRLSKDETFKDTKKKKLNAKQRKRLMKVVEAKEKKAKVSTLINAHHTWQVKVQEDVVQCSLHFEYQLD